MPLCALRRSYSECRVCWSRSVGCVTVNTDPQLLRVGQPWWVSMCFSRALDSYFIVKKPPYPLAKIATRSLFNRATQEHTTVKTQGYRPAAALSGLLSPRVHPAEHSLRVPRGHTASPIGARRRCVHGAQLYSR